MVESPPPSSPSNLITASWTSPQRERPEPHEALEHLERMALVTGNYIDVADGASLTLHRIVDALTARGVEVAVVSPKVEEPDLSEPETMFDVPSLGVAQGYHVPLRLGRHAARQLEEFDPQLVHIASPDPASLMAMRFARKRGLPITSSFHTNFPAYLKYWGPLTAVFSPMAWKLLKWFYAPCEQVFVPTESMGEELRSHGVLDEWAILARGVDESEFGRQFRSVAWRREYGIGPDERVVLFCARVVWEKGLRTLVDALERLRELEPDHRVVIVGDGAQRKWLEDHLPDAIFTGFLVDDDLARAYASSDLFLYPSTTDTFGNVTLEAMASGLPVVGACAPGTRSLVVDGESGILVTPEDAPALAEACSRLLGDDTTRRRMGREALERSAQFRWSNILDRFARDLDSIVGSESGEPEPSRSPSSRPPSPIR